MRTAFGKPTLEHIFPLLFYNTDSRLSSDDWLLMV